MKEKTLLEAARQFLLGEQEDNNITKLVQRYRYLVAPLYNEIIEMSPGDKITDKYTKATEKFISGDIRGKAHKILSDIERLEKFEDLNDLNAFPDIKIMIKFCNAIWEKDEEQVKSFLCALDLIIKENNPFELINRSKHIDREVKDFIDKYKKYFTKNVLSNTRNWGNQQNFR